MKKAVLLLSAFFCASLYAKYIEKPNPWSKISHPVAGSPQAIGGYSNGCQQGAEILPEQGIGYYDIRRFRHRYYSQPQTIATIQAIGKHVYQTTGNAILIGDLSQPIGGLMSYAHISHQNGLDADIYFAAIPQGSIPDRDHEPDSVVDQISGTMRMDKWQKAYREALYAAAQSPQTTRIFVNPIIKRYLCDTEADTRWLQKIRPWGGHDSHFHMRLACPPDSPLCVNQAPIPLGDGCTEDLNHWITDQSEAILHPKPAKPKKPKPRPEPPKSCKALLIKASSANEIAL
ncbi:penicillin-insensitive murein endopeptidase [Suttonella ornithocola]|uniref:Penicillin-insensitive murein endopeptidase n=1 Tax=Suttonella ornithocola TaxID=279832 RepID=A0A380MY57_9GAMM|nr:penicillin-insensitive murein endopeptidase [Suttonella ornithocola]SUO97510.1 Penicillin-insensitive murein endopeptidase precursor [Suttonella ornithocola]